ncbi:MAG: YihY/virulence factor BrkB family protein [Candidatus Rokubacteria bacterium]|nr:YihY/virulence factor BrkB family protein [Candidatus Rokubacteria bacterium]
MRGGEVARRLRGDLRGAVRRFLEEQGFLLASALSFAFVLCLVPLTLILLSVAGFLLESDAVAEYLFDSVTLLFPAYGSELVDLLGLLIRERAVTGLLGAAGLALFATQLFSLTRHVMNRAFRVSVRRGLLHGFAFDMVAVLLASSLVVGLAVVVVTLAALGDLVLRLAPLPLPPSIQARRVVALPVIYATGLGFLFLVYRAFPNTAVPVRAATEATLAVAALWEMSRWAFTGYVTVFGVYGKLYGSFGIGMALLVWIYYSAVLFVFGGALAAVLTERHLTRRTLAPPTGAAWEPMPAWEARAMGKGRGLLIRQAILVAVLAGAVAVLALQNSAPTTLRFLVWGFEGVPLATAILLAAAVGVLLVGPGLWVDRVRLRARVRALEARLAAAEAKLADRALGPAPPAADR